jgi:hypothetical protein
MFEDGTWKREIGKKDQIIALTTKLTEMQVKFDQQVASFATQQWGGNNTNNQSSSSNSDSRSRRSKKEPYTPYTVAAWRLIKTGDKVIMNGNNYHWCTKDHYSGGQKYNGMYAKHKEIDHDSWRKLIDDKRATRNSIKNQNNNATPAPAPSAAPAAAQKLTLNDKLCNAFFTQAGLSAEAVDRIWVGAQGNK